MIAIGSVNKPSAASPSSTARPPPMNRISMWPARMFANSRTDSEMIRTSCEITSMTKIGTAAAPAMPAGIQPLR